MAIWSSAAGCERGRVQDSRSRGTDEFSRARPSWLRQPERRRSMTMGKVRLDISMSLDGYVAGPDATLEDPLGRNGMDLHEWVFGLKSWRASHGMEGGETNADDEIVAEGDRRDRRRDHGPQDVQRRRGAVGPRPERGGLVGRGAAVRNAGLHPHSLLARDRSRMRGGTTFTFVNDGIESALEQARDAAGDKDVLVAGGADVAQQYLRAGLLDETADPRRARLPGRRHPPLRRTSRPRRRRWCRRGSSLRPPPSRTCATPSSARRPRARAPSGARAPRP